MFGGGGDDMVTVVEQSVQGQVDRVGGVEGPDHPFGRFGPQQLGCTLAATSQDRIDLDGSPEPATAGCGSQRAVVVIDGGVDGFGLRIARGRVVEIDLGHGRDSG